MCCFSGSPGVVKLVGKTNIFARAVGSAQRLAYSMNVTADEPVAMILPLPVPPGSAEDAVRFIDLSGYADFFGDLDRGFPPIVIPQPASRGPVSGGMMAVSTLEVHKVGSFEASFVPSLADFARLDERFRISDEVWRALPQYRDWGFAVFKLLDLKKGFFSTKPKTIHPMAFEFPRRDTGQLFFPTVHVHDGKVHDKAAFDHTLYYQAANELANELPTWLFRQLSEKPAGKFVDVSRSAGLIDGESTVRRILVQGSHPNRDIVMTGIT
jgi:hypothetical protein